ncbi:hypothetical protein WR25_26613 [Diploscapter pachys]|uniref:MYND-type domain-containing protein n=1 Tax=Diploscapter pachys TaxID=2018661 RepID=A0A2A2LC31_9BILA|nr:hypothetical protein WR25_26613 [Diploscapter pachys]
MDLIEEEAFAKVVLDNKLEDVCANCFQESIVKKFFHCAKCEVIHYCSKECQISDWINHKPECKANRRNSGRILNEDDRLIARIIWKLARGGDSPALNGRRWTDLDGFREGKHFPMDDERLDECMEDLAMYMGVSDLPKRDVVKNIIHKVDYNMMQIMNNQMVPIGIGIYVGLIAHKHSCNPDGHILFSGGKAVFRSRKKDVTYSKDLTVNYLSLMQTKEERNKHIVLLFGKECNCQVCQDEERDRMAMSVRCSVCSKGICPLNPDAGQLVCSTCGRKAPIGIKEALKCNQQVKRQLRKLDKRKKMDLRACMAESVNVYDRNVSKLSHINLYLGRLASSIQRLCSILKDKDLCRQFATAPLESYNYFLSPGDRDLTEVHFRSVVCMSRVLNDPNHPELRNLLQLTLSLSSISHGERFRDYAGGVSNNPFFSYFENEKEAAQHIRDVVIETEGRIQPENFHFIRVPKQ